MILTYPKHERKTSCIFSVYVFPPGQDWPDEKTRSPGPPCISVLCQVVQRTPLEGFSAPLHRCDLNWVGWAARNRKKGKWRVATWLVNINKKMWKTVGKPWDLGKWSTNGGVSTNLCSFTGGRSSMYSRSSMIFYTIRTRLSCRFSPTPTQLLWYWP